MTAASNRVLCVVNGAGRVVEVAQEESLCGFLQQLGARFPAVNVAETTMKYELRAGLPWFLVETEGEWRAFREDGDKILWIEPKETYTQEAKETALVSESVVLGPCAAGSGAADLVSRRSAPRVPVLPSHSSAPATCGAGVSGNADPLVGVLRPISTSRNGAAFEVDDGAISRPPRRRHGVWISLKVQQQQQQKKLQDLQTKFQQLEKEEQQRLHALERARQPVLPTPRQLQHDHGLRAKAAQDASAAKPQDGTAAVNKLETAQGIAPQGPQPAPQQDDELLEFGARFVSEASLPRGITVTPGMYCKAWCVQNTGRQPWNGIRLVYIGGKGVAPLQVKKVTQITTDVVHTHECVIVQVDISVPEVSGKMFGFFKLEDIVTGTRFGPKLWAFVNCTGTTKPAVFGGNSAPSALAPAPTPAPSVLTPASAPSAPAHAPSAAKSFAEFEVWCDNLFSRANTIMSVAGLPAIMFKRKLAHYFLIIHDLDIPRTLYELKLIQGVLNSSTTASGSGSSRKGPATATVATVGMHTSAIANGVAPVAAEHSCPSSSSSIAPTPSSSFRAASVTDESPTSFQTTLQRFQEYAQCRLPVFDESVRDCLVPELLHQFVLTGNNSLRDKRNFRDSEIARRIHTQSIQEPVLISFLEETLASIAKHKYDWVLSEILPTLPPVRVSQQNSLIRELFGDLPATAALPRRCVRAASGPESTGAAPAADATRVAPSSNLPPALNSGYCRDSNANCADKIAVAAAESPRSPSATYLRPMAMSSSSSSGTAAADLVIAMTGTCGAALALPSRSPPEAFSSSSPSPSSSSSAPASPSSSATSLPGTSCLRYFLQLDGSLAPDGHLESFGAPAARAAVHRTTRSASASASAVAIFSSSSSQSSATVPTLTAPQRATKTPDAQVKHGEASPTGDTTSDSFSSRTTKSDTPMKHMMRDRKNSEENVIDSYHLIDAAQSTFSANDAAKQQLSQPEQHSPEPEPPISPTLGESWEVVQ